MGHVVSLKSVSVGAGEMIQWLKACTALLEDASSVPKGSDGYSLQDVCTHTYILCPIVKTMKINC